LFFILFIRIYRLTYTCFGFLIEAPISSYRVERFKTTYTNVFFYSMLILLCKFIWIKQHMKIEQNKHCDTFLCIYVIHYFWQTTVVSFCLIMYSISYKTLHTQYLALSFKVSFCVLKYFLLKTSWIDTRVRPKRKKLYTKFTYIMFSIKPKNDSFFFKCITY
jgi:hypothetical protein